MFNFLRVKIKKATQKNLKDIQELSYHLASKEKGDYDEALDKDWIFSEAGEKYFLYNLKSKDSCVLVAEAKDRVVGYLIGSIVETSTVRQIGSMAELENMYVIDSFRNKGVGKKLCNEFMEWARAREVERVRVWTYFENKRALNFYRKQGFENYNTTLEKKL